MISIENNGSNIIIYGRNNNKPYRIHDTSFKPYFYYIHKDGEYKSIDGLKLKKKICSTPKALVSIRNEYGYRDSKAYEADIVYTNRYIIDKIKKIEKESIRIFYFDIEIKRTKDGIYKTPEEAENIILSVCCYDSFDCDYKTFYNEKLNNEKSMILEFIEYLNKCNPDILVAWNGNGFDFPFLINRLKKLKINPKKLSRDNGDVYSIKSKTRNFYRTKIYGRVCFDLMQAYKKITSGGRESWSLDYISRYELKDKGGKEKYKGDLDELYNNDIDKFLKYNKRDVELLVLLNEKLGIIDFFDEVRRLCFCTFEDVFMNSKIADCLCLKYAKEHEFVLPSCRNNQRNRYEGGFVQEPEAKLHKNIATMDMKSLYPSIMIGFNTSYETILPEKTDNCINCFNTYFYKKSTGMIPSIVKPLLNERAKIKKEMNKYDRNSIEYKSKDITQYALKVIANSFYGVMGFPIFRLYRREVADSITLSARNIIKYIAEWFNKHGHKVIYGDTDSVFIDVCDKSISELVELKDILNNEFITYFEKMGIDKENNIFELEFEKIYKTILFKRKSDGTAAKKRYAGRRVWYNGKVMDEIDIVGFESKRSDSPEIGRKFMKEVLKKIVYEEGEELIREYVNNFRNDIRSGNISPEKLALPIGITKSLDKYGNQIHARASRFANEKHNAGIKQGDKVKYIYIKGTDNVIAFKDYMWDGYNIDYDLMAKRIVDMKIGPLFNGLGWSYEYISFKRKKKKEKWENKFKQMTLWEQ